MHLQVGNAAAFAAAAAAAAPDFTLQLLCLLLGLVVAGGWQKYHREENLDGGLSVQGCGQGADGLDAPRLGARILDHLYDLPIHLDRTSVRESGCGRSLWNLSRRVVRTHSLMVPANMQNPVGSGNSFVPPLKVPV
eukprot:1160340-Pelagomonas_calceolata.AAC.5